MLIQCYFEILVFFSNLPPVEKFQRLRIVDSCILFWFHSYIQWEMIKCAYSSIINKKRKKRAYWISSRTRKPCFILCNCLFFEKIVSRLYLFLKLSPTFLFHILCLIYLIHKVFLCFSVVTSASALLWFVLDFFNSLEPYLLEILWEVR